MKYLKYYIIACLIAGLASVLFAFWEDSEAEFFFKKDFKNTDNIVYEDIVYDDPFLGGTTCTWTGNKNNDMLDVENWDRADDCDLTVYTDLDLIWNTGATSSAAVQNIEANSITITSGYSGNWSIAGVTASTSGNISFDGTGTLNLGNGLTLNGASATLHVGSGVGTVTASSCSLTLNGTTGMTLDDDKSVTWKSLVLGSAAKVSNSNALTLSNTTGASLTLGTNSTLTTNGSLRIYCNQSTNSFILGAGYSIVAAAGAIIYLNTEVTQTLPGIVFTGAGSVLYIWPQLTGNNVTVTLGGAISSPGDIRLRNNGFTNVTFTTNNYSLTAVGTLYFGGNVSVTYNFGASIITANEFNGATYNTGTINTNLGSSQWTVSGNWAFGSNHTVNPGTSKVTFTNTATITSNAKHFYQVDINAPTKTITLADNLTVDGGCNAFKVLAGTVSYGAYKVIGNECGGALFFSFP